MPRTKKQIVLEIEDGIPVPPRMSTLMNRDGNIKYPFDEMLLGQSFFVSLETRNPYLVAASINFRNAKRDGKHFMQRLVEGGCRVWRDK